MKTNICRILQELNSTYSKHKTKKLICKETTYFGIKSTNNKKITVLKSGSILGSISLFGSTVKCLYLAKNNKNILEFYIYANSSPVLSSEY
jgi:hypothetical protein